VYLKIKALGKSPKLGQQPKLAKPKMATAGPAKRAFPQH